MTAVSSTARRRGLKKRDKEKVVWCGSFTPVTRRTRSVSRLPVVRSAF